MRTCVYEFSDETVKIFIDKKKQVRMYKYILIKKSQLPLLF